MCAMIFLTYLLVLCWIHFNISWHYLSEKIPETYFTVQKTNVHGVPVSADCIQANELVENIEINPKISFMI